MKNKEMQTALIGLGKFGGSLCKEFTKLGASVLAMDSNPDKVKEYSTIATHVIHANPKDEEVLKELGIRNFDLAVVSLGDDIQSSILTTLALKEVGVIKVWAKAQSKYHGTILDKVGADRVIYPEQDIAKRLAYHVVSDKILDYIELSNEHSILEMIATKKINNKTIQELDVRAKFGCTIVGIKKQENIIISPSADERIYNGDILVVIGSNSELKKFEKKEL
ncbi:potassium channel family protein [Virgibacillus necropolis]|uniref:Potassium transporter Trk n=1 Tax=Virgibacillus necropolis TaxID=163877 RepID=A0A221MHC2_9BACI|nr:TrkA family potassium uptake protein [Virgibacillus necropolis]ASN07031.1 potassium transporter Trk [Virgibacillus necropolis]